MIIGNQTDPYSSLSSSKHGKIIKIEHLTKYLPVIKKLIKCNKFCFLIVLFYEV